MFGSHARREAREDSDVDVLAISDGRALSEASIDWLRSAYGPSVDIAHYTYPRIAGLAAAGSLFTWHLRREGVPLNRGEGRLERILTNMNPYRGHVRDMDVLVTVFDDAVESLSQQCAVQFDLGVIGTVVRNTGIIVHDLFGSHDFSPAAPLRLATIAGAPQLPITDQEYQVLQACRRASERGGRVPVSSGPSVVPQGGLAKLQEWLYLCGKCAQERGGEE